MCLDRFLAQDAVNLAQLMPVSAVWPATRTALISARSAALEPPTSIAAPVATRPSA
jgi:hypothetical protein